MSVDPNMLAQMLMSQGGGATNSLAPGGLQTNNTAPVAANLIQKMMLIKALQNQKPQQLQTSPTDPNVLGQVAAQPQVLQAQQLPGGTNA